MGCCALESGDVAPAIPFRNLMIRAAQPFRWCQQEELAQFIKFLIGIAETASPPSSAQQPMDQVF